MATQGEWMPGAKVGGDGAVQGVIDYSMGG